MGSDLSLSHKLVVVGADSLRLASSTIRSRKGIGLFAFLFLLIFPLAGLS